MKLLPQTAKDENGQVLVIFLLVLVVGLAIALSIASRTVTDIRQTTTSDESNRSYFAAESGVEKALQQIKAGSFRSGNIDFSATNSSKGSYSIANLTLPADPNYVFDLGQLSNDEDAQVVLMTDFNDLNTAGSVVGSNDGLNVYYNSAVILPIPAIEVSIVTYTSSSVPSWNQYKFAFDTTASLPARNNNFCMANVSQGNFGPFTTQTGVSISYNFKAIVKFNDNCGGKNDSLPVGAKPVLARIKLLYRDTNMGVQAIDSSGAVVALPTQGQIITSTGTTPSGVTRKLIVTHLYPALPTIFDYVLFNGSTNCLTKTSPPTC